MTVDARKYKPLPISQRDTLLAADGVDDCRAVAATYLAASATLGEILIHPTGTQMGRRSRTALVKRARRSLGPSFASGPLNTTATTNMLHHLVPDAPVLQPAGLDFGTLRDKLRKGYSASLSGNPSHIRGASPLKRVGDVGHELYLHREDDQGRILVGDPYKPYAKRFGEWVPAAAIRSFAYKDSDQSLVACFTVKRGAWTAEALATDTLADAKAEARKAKARLVTANAEIDALDEKVAALTAQLADSQSGDAKRAAGWESALINAIGTLQALRAQGPGGTT